MKNTAKILCLVLTLSMLLGVFASCVKPPVPQPETDTESESASESTTETDGATETETDAQTESETEDPLKDYTVTKGDIYEHTTKEKNDAGADKIRISAGNYTIIRDSKASQSDIDKGAMYLYKQLIEEAKCTLKLKTDFAAPVDNEILIGPTTRVENIDTTDLGSYDYGWKVVGTKIVIFGGSMDAISLAVDAFIEKYYNASALDLEIPADADFLATYNYPYSEIKIADKDISDLTILFSGEYEETASYLASKIGMLTGDKLEMQKLLAGETPMADSILVGVELSGSFNSIYALEDGTLTFKPNGTEASFAYLEKAIDKFFEDKIPTVEDFSTLAISDSFEVTVENVLDGMEYVSQDFVDSLDSEFEANVEAILNAPSEWETGEGGRVFYVSNSEGDDSNDGRSPEAPWKTLKKASTTTQLRPGDVVLFKRGDVWNVMDKNEYDYLGVQAGVTVSAYGDPASPKPMITAGLWANDPDDWVSVGENLWVYNGWYTSEISSDFPNDESLPGSYVISNNLRDGGDDIGNIIFTRKSDGKVGWGIKITKYAAHDKTVNLGTISNGFETVNKPSVPFADHRDLKHNLDFYHNPADSRLYLYCEGNPTETYSDIILVGRRVGIQGYDNTTIDNMCVRYIGYHGVNGVNAENFTIRNCEIGWIGGTIQTYSYGGRDYPTRLGEGIQNAYDCNGYNVLNNYFYQVYDGAISSQMTRQPGVVMQNIHVAGNMLEYNTMNIEFWMNNVNGPAYQFFNMVVEENMMRNIAMGFGQTRPIMSGGTSFGDIDAIGSALFSSVAVPSAWAINTYYRNNTMWRTAQCFMVSANFSTDESEHGIKVVGNTIVGEYGCEFGGLPRDPNNMQQGAWDLTRYRYTAEVIKQLMEDKVIGENNYLFTYTP